MSTKTILCDADGVFLDFVGALCLELVKQGFQYSPEDFRSWDLREALSREATRAMFEIMGQPGFCHSIAWYEGAREFFEALAKEGNVFVVTAPFDSETWERERKAALQPFPRNRVLPIPGEHKKLVRGDVLIEDHPGNAFDWLEANPEGIALLIDRPWNGFTAKEWHCHRRMYRVKSYAEALTTIRECA